MILCLHQSHVRSQSLSERDILLPQPPCVFGPPVAAGPECVAMPKMNPKQVNYM